MRNRYICNARISEHKFKELLKMFCNDVAGADREQADDGKSQDQSADL